MPLRALALDGDAVPLPVAPAPVTLADIRAAARRIAGAVLRTPTLPSHAVSRAVGAPLTGRPRQDSVPRRRPATDPARRTSNSSIDSGCARESGQTRLPVAAADTARPATPAA